ncbi:MAG: OmpA family protein [Bacteroidetes bacterium]|nr:OmpA family protein [Bacteroidota bacterium]
MFFILLLLFCFAAKAQINYKLSGKIIDSKTKEGIGKAFIRLVSSSGGDFETGSDSLGFYHFSDSVLTPNVSYLLTVRSPLSPENSRVPYGKCPYSYCFSGPKEYLSSSDRMKFKTDDSLQFKNYKYDFCLIEMLRCGWTIPSVYFEKNSTDFNFKRMHYQDFEVLSDTAMDCLIGFMKCNPHFVVEIRGNADSSETKKQKLSELRAKKVNDIFIEKGIDKKRLHAKGYGADRPIEKRNEEGSYIGTYSGEVNRNVTIYLLSKDFNEPSQEKNVGD